MADDDKKETNDIGMEITIYSMPGSQFTGKVLAALDARNIPHYSVFVPMSTEQRKKVIPSGGTMVPELKAVYNATVEGDDAAKDDENKKPPPLPAIVPDSEAILHWLDDHLDTNFFPTESIASDVSVRASSKILTGAVWYYNWVDTDGYKRSMEKSLIRGLKMPSFLPNAFNGWILGLFLSSTKTKFRKSAKGALGIEDDKVLNDPKQIEKLLVGELQYFQSLLAKEDEEEANPYLLATKESTAADFSVYAQVERLVGDMGDGNVPPAIPQLKEDTATELKRFWKWHQYMRDHHPIKFKGKRPRKKEDNQNKSSNNLICS